MKADLILVEEAKAGNLSAFSELVKRHQRALLRLCLRFTHDLESAEEVVQETFVKAYEKIDLFEGRSSFKSWLFQIGINTAKNLLRGRRQDAVSLDDVSVAVAAVAESSLVQEDIRNLLQKAVAELPERQKLAVILRIYEDLSFKEIAEAMGCPYDTAKANFRHGLLKVKESFEGTSLFAEWLKTETEEISTVSLARSAAEVDA